MNIYKNTVSDLLWKTLSKLMTFKELKSYRLVGGTGLSLLMGHRMSLDIDMFSDAPYGSIDFDIIDQLLIASFPYVEMGYGGNNSMGKSYFIGNNPIDTIKVDLFYTDPFIYPAIEFKKIRIAQLEEIAAMKLEVVAQNGRKKDFWDLHELMEYYSISNMLDFYKKRYPYSYSRKEILHKLTDFKEADTDFEPICLKDKHWELIKLDFEEKVIKEG